MTATIVASTAAFPCGQPQTKSSGLGLHERFGGYRPPTGEWRLRLGTQSNGGSAGQPLLGFFLDIAIPLAKKAVCHYGMPHGLKLVGSNLNRRNLEMTFAAPQLFSARLHRLHRLRWVLYVVLALVGGSVTFVGAHAQQRASEEATFRKLIDSYCAAWSTANPDNPAKFYAKEDGLVFYDIAPFSYHSWKEYHDGVQKNFFDNITTRTLTAGKDLKVTRRGNIAWTTVPMHLSYTSKDGKTTEAEIRYTGVWEKRGPTWLIVHEHLSTPMT